MAQDHYEFELYASRVDLWLGYAGTLGTVVLTGGLLVFAMGRSGAQAIGLYASSALLFLFALLVTRRVLVEAYTLKLGTAGAFYQSLRAERFLRWPDIAQVRLTGRTLRIAFRDGDGFDEVWARVGDAKVGERIVAFAQHQAKRRTAERQAAVAP